MTTLDERKSKSFDIVIDTVKLMVTLSTAIIGYLATTILVPSKENPHEALKRHTCGISWSIWTLGLCVLCGILTILKITGTLGNGTLANDKVTIYISFTQWLFGLALFCFFLAISILGYVTLCEIHKMP